MIKKILSLFKRRDYNPADNIIKETDKKFDCCILGYHKWIYVVDKNGDIRYRICDVCGEIEKGHITLSFSFKGIKKIFIPNSIAHRITEEEKKALLNCISYNKKKRVYILNCDCK